MLTNLWYQFVLVGGSMGPSLRTLAICILGCKPVWACPGDPWRGPTRQASLPPAVLESPAGQDPFTARGKHGSFMVRAQEVKWHWEVGRDHVCHSDQPLPQPLWLTAKEVKQWVEAKRTVSLKSPGGHQKCRKALLTWQSGGLELGQPQKVAQGGPQGFLSLSWQLTGGGNNHESTF